MVYFIGSRTGPGGREHLEVLCVAGVKERARTEIYAGEKV